MTAAIERTGRLKRRVAQLSVAAVLVASGAAGVPVAMADPAGGSEPSTSVDGQLSDLQNQAADVAVQVAALDEQVAALDQQLADAETDVERAGEDYARAQVALDDAQAAADDSAARLQTALDRQESSRRVVAAVAREFSRTGSAADKVQILLSADGLADAAAESNAYDIVSTRSQQAVQQYQADSVVAQTLKEINDANVASLSTAKEQASATLTDAENAQASLESVSSDVAGQRDALIDQLTQIRHTTREVESQRLDEIAAQREAAAQQALETPAPAPAATSAPAAPAPATPAATAPATSAPAAPAPAAPAPTPTPTPAAPAPAPTPTPTPTPAPAPGSGTSVGTTSAADIAVQFALSKVGKPYIWGGVGPTGYDCSGLTSQAWLAAGVWITRTADSQYRYVKKIAYSEMRPGDMIFYGDDPNNSYSITHVAMYIGNGQMVEAPRPGKTVQVVPVRWTRAMPYAGRA